MKRTTTPAPPPFPGLVAPLSAVLALTACASDAAGGYPSLARRDAERVTARAQPVEAAAQPALPPLSADLDSRIVQLVSEAREANAQFSARRSATQRALANGGRAAAGSESWTEAQIALADLEAARSRATISLAELDRLYADERLAHAETVSPTAEALAAARDRVAAWVEEQDRVLRVLGGG